MSRGLDRLNTLPAEAAEAELLACCGSRAWAARLAELRPFAAAEALLEAADRIARELGPEDWLEAFRSHPRIGEGEAATPQPEGVRRWSRAEQAGVAGADEATRAALAEGNRRYEERFGHIFLICATGLSAVEMLEALNRRLDNDPATELAVAAAEQRRIARLRLARLLQEGGGGPE